MQFLSALSWVQGNDCLVDGIGGGNHPRPMSREKSTGFSITRDFDLSYLPEPDDDRTKLAFAIMREGRRLNHPAYAFPSFYRVLEVALPEGRQRRR